MGSYILRFKYNVDVILFEILKLSSIISDVNIYIYGWAGGESTQNP